MHFLLSWHEKRPQKHCLAIFATMLIFFSISPLAAQSLLLVTDNTPGGRYINGGGATFNEKNPGLEIELYRMVAKKLGLQLTMKRLPWKLCLQQLEYNKVDGVFPASYKLDRMKIGHYPMKDGVVDPSRKTRDNAYYLYKLKGSSLTWNGEEFSGLTGVIGVPLGWAIVEDLNSKGVAIKELAIHENTPDMLIQKRLQGFICLESVFDTYLQRKPEVYKKIIKEIQSIWEKPYYLMLSRQFVQQNPGTAEDIWNAIREIKETETFSSIVNKYIH
ncbi:MAG: amino acid ABC transporter substrate-binding protein [Desulfobulbaceae bacterium]|nr:amino acid ABC transporter substrate-binding protein [Desulfobulbaceae bacterium]